MVLYEIAKRAAAVITAFGLATAGTVVAAPAAYATSFAPPPGYDGPVNQCPGQLPYVLWLHHRPSGLMSPATLEIWYSPSGNGTYCAFTRDNIEGAHHMAVVVRRADWTTRAYDTGVFNYYAGGIKVFGPAAGQEHVFFYGEMTEFNIVYEMSAECFGDGYCRPNETYP